MCHSMISFWLGVVNGTVNVNELGFKILSYFQSIQCCDKSTAIKSTPTHVCSTINFIGDLYKLKRDRYWLQRTDTD